MQELPTIQPGLAPELTPAEIAALSEEVRALAAQRNAVILAHNYQLPEIQDVADHLGDSLRAINLSDLFMRVVVANLDNDWVLTSTDVDDFITKKAVA